MQFESLGGVEGEYGKYHIAEIITKIFQCYRKASRTNPGCLRNPMHINTKKNYKRENYTEVHNKTGKNHKKEFNLKSTQRGKSHYFQRCERNNGSQR